MISTENLARNLRNLLLNFMDFVRKDISATGPKGLC